VRAIVGKCLDPAVWCKLLAAHPGAIFTANGPVVPSGSELRKTLRASNNNHKRLDRDASTGVVSGKYPAPWGILVVAGAGPSIRK
jgi:hypothetical protein